MREFIGKVTEGPFGTGSKSEHQAVCMETAQGRYVLRRQDGNPFYDPELKKLVGKTIRCIGIISDYVLLISEWTVINGETNQNRRR